MLRWWSTTWLGTGKTLASSARAGSLTSRPSPRGRVSGRVLAGVGVEVEWGMGAE